MPHKEIARKNLDNQEFLQLREATQRISEALSKRLKRQLSVLKPLFFPRKLFGTRMKGGTTGTVTGEERAFAELQKQYAAICTTPFNLSTKLDSPLSPLSADLDAAPFQYLLEPAGAEGKPIAITSPCSWTLSYHSEGSLSRLRAMLAGSEPRQPEDMMQGIIHHLAPVLFLKKYPQLQELLDDLRYKVEIRNLDDLGGLPVVMLTTSIGTFLPPDEFIQQVTQFSGIPAFQEIVDPAAIENLPDPLREWLRDV
jgi:hypothetical protein